MDAARPNGRDAGDLIGPGRGDGSYRDPGPGEGRNADPGNGDSRNADPGNGDSGQRPWRAATGLIGVLAVLVLVLWLLSLTSGNGSGSGDTGSDGGRPEDSGLETPTTSIMAQPPDTVSAPEPAPNAAAAGPFSPLTGELIYLSDRHVVVVDLATGALRRVLIDTHGSVLVIGDLRLLTDSKRTVGLSSAGGPPTAVVLASGAELVLANEPLVEFWVVSRPDGPRGATRLNAWQDYGVVTGNLQAPPGSEVLAVPGGGLLLNSPAGGTFRPTLGRFEVVSEHRSLAASRGLRVEQRCDDRLRCSVVAIDEASGEASDLPMDFVAQLGDIHISPDRRWLLNDTNPARVLDRLSQEVRLLPGGGYGRPVWSDDSTFVAWLTSDRTPTLVVALTGPTATSDDWIVVELTGLGVDPSPGSSFLLSASLTPP